MKQAIITVLALLLGTLTASADILRGRIIDAETKEPLPEASLELKQQADYNGHLATWIMRSNTDSVGCFNMRLMGRGTLSASMLGYYTKTKVVMGFSDSTKDTIDVGDIALKPSETLMKMLEVKGRARRFTVRGDTIVFNPEAFHLEEGTRLDELIRQLPGVEVAEDGSLTWNGKPIRITMDGESLFGGNDIINQLPVEAVENIKAYNKASKLSERTGKDDGSEDMVLDLTIKPGFLDRWYGDVAGTYQTPKHYNADLHMNRLSKTNPAMVNAYANNMAREGTRTMHGGWGSWGNNYGQSQGASAGYQHNIREKEGTQEMRSSYSVSGGLTHTDDWRTSYSETLNLMEDAATKRTYTEDYKRNHKLNPYFNFDWMWDIDSLNTIYGDIDVSHKRTRSNGSRDMRQDDLLQQLTHSTGEGRETNISADAHWYHFIDEDNAFGANFNIRYTDGKNESWMEREIKSLSPDPSPVREGRLIAASSNFTPLPNRGGVGGEAFSSSPLRGVGGEASFLSQHSHTPTSTFSTAADVFYKRWLAKRWLMDVSYGINYQRQRSHQDFETNGLADQANSYRDNSRTTTHDLKLGSTIDLSPVKIMPGFTTQWKHEWKDYQRGQLDTTATRRRMILNPRMHITWKMNKTNGMELDYSLATNQPSLISTLAYSDQTDPLFITEGNPNLKDTHTNNLLLTFNSILSKQQLSLSATIGYKHNDRMTSNALTYQPSTGIYTSRPENVPGGHTWNFRLNYDQGFGDVVRLQNNFRLTADQSYAFLTQLIPSSLSPDPSPVREGRGLAQCRQPEKRLSPQRGEQGEGLVGEASLNRQSLLNPFENLTVSFDWAWLKASVFAELNANRLRYSDAAEQNTTQWNNRFGAEGELTRGNFVFKTKIYEQMYRGYTIESMNRNMLVWDASVAWKILKNKGKLTLELDDILNNEDHKYYSQTAYQQTTSWMDFRHHYASLTFTYHLDAKVKD